MAENAKIELITKSLSAATSRKLNKNDEYDYMGNFPEKERTYTGNLATHGTHESRPM